MLSSKAAKMLVLQEEVHAQVGFRDDCRVLDGELADTWQHKILQCLDANNTRSVVDEKNVRVLEGKLTGSSPQSELSVVSAVISSYL